MRMGLLVLVCAYFDVRQVNELHPPARNSRLSLKNLLCMRHLIFATLSSLGALLTLLCML
jgi:hypothetical protein